MKNFKFVFEKVFTSSIELKKSFLFQKIKQPTMAPKCHSSHHFLTISQHLFKTISAFLFNCSHYYFQTDLASFLKQFPPYFYTVLTTVLNSSRHSFYSSFHHFFEQFALLFWNSSHHCSKTSHILFLESFHDFFFLDSFWFLKQFLFSRAALVF